MEEPPPPVDIGFFAVMLSDSEGSVGGPVAVPLAEADELTNPQIALGDFDGSGRPLALITAGTQVWRLGLDPDEGPYDVGPFLLPRPATHLVAGNLNGDPLDDIAFSVANTPHITFMGNDGQGGFTGQKNVDAGIYTHALVLGDVNGDGNPEVLAGGLDFRPDVDPPPHEIRVLSREDGNYVSGRGFVVPGGLDAMAAADMNGDGLLDVVTVGKAPEMAAQVTVMVGDGEGRFSPGFTGESGPAPTDVDLADMDGDGFVDAVISNGGGITILLGDGAGALVPGPSMQHVGGGTAATADIDGDGSLDVVLAAEVDRMRVWMQTDGVFDNTFNGEILRSPQGSQSHVIAGDWNGDGAPDFMLSRIASF